MSKFLKGFWNYTNLSNNTTLKIVSVLFSIMFWFYVMGDINPEVTIAIDNIDVEMLNMEELSESGLVIIGQKDYVVQVEITGRRNDVYSVSSKDIKIGADVMGFQAGMNSIPLDISVPPAVRLTDFAPKQIKVELDRVVQKQKPVQIIRTNKHLDGFMTEQPSYEIKEVLVAGPESFVNNVEKVIGEIDVGGLTGPVTQNVPLRAVDGEGNEVGGVALGQAYASVYLHVYRFGSLPVKPEVVGTAGEGYKIVEISAIPETVQLQGDSKALELMQSVSTGMVDVEGLTETTEIEVPLLVPDKLEASYLTEPVKVVVRIEPVKIKEIIVGSDSVVVENLGSGLSTNLSEIDEDITIKVSDVESVLETVNHRSVALSLNLEGLAAGTHQIAIDFEENDFMGFEVIPATLEIEIMDESTETDSE